MRFEFASATRILFGGGVVHEVAPAAREMGRRALLVTGRSRERSAPLVAELSMAGIQSIGFTMEAEPELESIRQGAQQARREACDMVISMGGGSAIDAGKAIAALLTNSGDLMDYLEVIGDGKPLRSPAAPFVAIPTTAGTGSEVTRNAVLASAAHQVKVSLRSPLMLPRLAVADPELTLGLPPALTARSGLDALTQLIEPYVSARSNPMTDGFCREGLQRISHALRHAYHSGNDREARSEMSLAALLGGLALANSGLGVVHGLAGPLGGMFPAPHGAICATLLPHGMEANIRALHARAPQSEALRRYDTVAQLLAEKPDARAEEGVEWVRQLCQDLEIPALGAYGVLPRYLHVVAERAARASSMQANPIKLTSEELQEVLMRAL